MSVILVLVAFSVVLAGGFLAAFFWSVRDGQYDDTYSASVRILFEDDKPDDKSEPGLSAASPPHEQSPNQ
jgi:cbb3-type cytochrome oxidase maturation protein